MKAISIAKALLLATFITAFTAAATAQARPAVTQDRDQAGRNFYTVSASCSSLTYSYCSVVFPTPPAGKRLIVTRVSILNLMPTADTITSIDLRYQNGSILAFLAPVFNTGVSGTYNYTVNDTVFAKFDAGEVPQLLTFVTPSTTSMQMVGIISGYMIDIP
jgi:hypothetical protein